jgi:hypothetical protein
MKIEFRCHKCKKILKTFTNIQGMDDIVIDVFPCDNLDCRDCSTCDDAHRSKVSKRKDERYPKKKKKQPL